MPNVNATTSHTCSLTSHCYAVQWLEWESWPFSGLREEYGVKATHDVTGMSDETGDNNFIVSSVWIMKNTNPINTWIEFGVIQGDYPDCPSDAETTKRYYWLSWGGVQSCNHSTYNIIKLYPLCI